MSQRRALGALFLLLAVSLAGIAVGAIRDARDEGVGWAIAIAAAALAVWLASMAFRAMR